MLSATRRVSTLRGRTGAPRSPTPRRTSTSHDLDTTGPEGDVLREVVLHLVEEYARHCGHADLLRERIDGRIGQ